MSKEDKELHKSKERRQEEVNRRERKEEELRQERIKEHQVQKLRERKQVVQENLNIAKNSKEPLNEVNWDDNNLKSVDHRKLREILRKRGYSDEDITNRGTQLNHEEESEEDLDQQVDDLAKEVVDVKSTSKIFSLIRGTFSRRRSKESKKKRRRRRLLFILPTVSIVLFGIMLFGLTLVATGQFIGTMLSHPEAIKELYEHGLLGDAMTLGNVTEDVEVDGEVIVKGNKKAQPGCFEYNGVMYCGHCLTTEGGASSSNRGEGSNIGQGTGNYTGKLSLPVAIPYTVTSNYGMRWIDDGQGRRLHGGIDLVPANDLDIVSAGGGEVIYTYDGCAPNSGKEGNRCGSGFGNWVEVLHEGDKDSDSFLSTRYAHFNKVYVKVGDKVDAGTKLGLMGHTGNSTGPHLHFEVLEGGHGEPRRNARDYMVFGKVKQWTSQEIQDKAEEAARGNN